MKKIVFCAIVMISGFFAAARTPEINSFFIEYKKLIKSAEDTIALQVYSELPEIEKKYDSLEEICKKLSDSKGWEQSDTEELNELRAQYEDAIFQLKLFAKKKQPLKYKKSPNFENEKGAAYKIQLNWSN